MLISSEMQSALNAQIGREMDASRQYLSMAAYLDSRALKMLSKRFFDQSAEEREHALKIARYLLDVDAQVEIPAVDAPKVGYQTVEEVVKNALDWEVEITGCINQLMTLAIQQADYATQDFLRWFVTEQVEEISNMTTMLQVVQTSGERNLLMVEAYLIHNK